MDASDGIAIGALVASVVLGGGSVIVAIIAERRARRVEVRQDASGIDWKLSLDPGRARLTITNLGVDDARDVTASAELYGVTGSGRSDFVKAMGGAIVLDFPAVLPKFSAQRAVFDAEGVGVPVTVAVVVNVKWRVSGRAWHHKRLTGETEHWV
ncbi:hypothetical protein [Microbacterium sp. A93]|uniref:hypothetical protein n=1 Tax=Microbacterium sp. A93 TaxID=3450716 RepID=UPI003F431670